MSYMCRSCCVECDNLSVLLDAAANKRKFSCLHIL